MYHYFLIDLDGTLYRGEEKIPDAPPFLHWLRQEGIPFAILTNNSTRSPAQVAGKLRQMGFKVHPEEIYTSSIATAEYLKGKAKGKRIYAIGEEGLYEALHLAGFTLVDGQDPNGVDVVVCGLDREVTYEKLARAALAIRAGASFIGTNEDRALPTERGFLPGAGSLIRLLAATTEVEPLYIGKPSSLIIQMALINYGFIREETVLIGDNLRTDILSGIHGGIETILLYTGVTTPEEARRSDIKATHSFHSLTEVKNWLMRNGRQTDSCSRV